VLKVGVSTYITFLIIAATDAEMSIGLVVILAIFVMSQNLAKWKLELVSLVV